MDFQCKITAGHFFALGCPCEVLVDSTDRYLAETLVKLAREEAWRIEKKWSRYLPNSMIEKINRSAGSPITVDDETARMITFSESLHKLSDGIFDITSGVLRKVWNFNPGSKLPSQSEIETVMSNVGWGRVHWQSPVIRMDAGMQLDFGGTGKEYAVDQCLKILADFGEAVLVNFGGDLACTGAPRNSEGWLVGIDASEQMIILSQGAIASSGDTYRYLEHQGKRYSHILDARTGWPVDDSPASVTVLADTCTTAGMLSTLALTQGANAERFLREQSVKYFIDRTFH